jgi:hypothetical protein
MGCYYLLDKSQHLSDTVDPAFSEAMSGVLWIGIGIPIVAVFMVINVFFLKNGFALGMRMQSGLFLLVASGSWYSVLSLTGTFARSCAILYEMIGRL